MERKEFFLAVKRAYKEERGGAVYTDQNFKTKKAFKEALKSGEPIALWSPGIGSPKKNGTEYVEGPHYPKPHSWYAQVEVKDGLVVKIK